MSWRSRQSCQLVSSDVLRPWQARQDVSVPGGSGWTVAGAVSSGRQDSGGVISTQLFIVVISVAAVPTAHRVGVLRRMEEGVLAQDSNEESCAAWGRAY